MASVSYFLEHLEELLIYSSNPLKKAEYFGLLFEKTPTYEELLSGTPKLARYLGLKHQFANALVPLCEPAVPEVEPQALFDSLVYTYEKLKTLGFTHYNGEVVIIESEEEVSHV